MFKDKATKKLLFLIPSVHTATIVYVISSQLTVLFLLILRLQVSGQDAAIRGRGSSEFLLVILNRTTHKLMPTLLSKMYRYLCELGSCSQTDVEINVLVSCYLLLVSQAVVSICADGRLWRLQKKIPSRESRPHRGIEKITRKREKEN